MTEERGCRGETEDQMMVTREDMADFVAGRTTPEKEIEIRAELQRPTASPVRSWSKRGEDAEHAFNIHWNKLAGLEPK